MHIERTIRAANARLQVVERVMVDVDHVEVRDDDDGVDQRVDGVAHRRQPKEQRRRPQFFLAPLGPRSFRVRAREARE